MLYAKDIQAAPLTRSRFIALSAMNILNAGELSTSTRAAAEEAKRVYGNLCRGMWKSIQADARRIIATCNKEGLSLERPYKLVKDEHNGCTVLYTIDSRGRLFPAKRVGPRNK